MQGSIALVFKDNNTKVLLIKRRDMPVWVFPGGGIEENETPENAVIREAFEETGYNVEIKRKVGVYTKKSKCNHIYECVIKSGKPTLSNESCAIEFIDINNLPTLRSPYLDFYIKETLLNDINVKEATLPDINKKDFAIVAITHPWALFKYLLTRFGIHWNI